MLRAIGASPNNNVISLAQSNVPSYSLTGTTSRTLLDVVNITVPATITPDTELLVNISWSCSSSANTKQLDVNFGDIGTLMATLFSDIETTNISNELMFRITFSGQTATAQLVSSSKVPGSSSTTAFKATTFTMTYSGIAGQPLQMAFWGTMASASDSMQIQRYSIWAVQGKSYPTNRLLPGKKIFWGANAHFNDLSAGGGAVTNAQMASCMTAMNATTLRLTVENVGYTWQSSDASLAAIVNLAQYIQANSLNIQLYVCIDLDQTSDGTNQWPNEQAAYTYGYLYAQHVVSALKPYGVTMFECGNELDTKYGNGTSGGGTWGYYPYTYSIAQWPIMRGIIHGAVDGVHSLGCLAASNAFTIASVGAMVNLWNGNSPAAGNTVTPGGPPVRWDISAFHNYQSYGFLTGMQTFVNGPYFNVYQYLKEQFGVPIIISEFNGNGGWTEAQNAAYCTRLMNEAWNLKYKYNIAGVLVYQMFQGDPWGMVATPSTATLSNPLGTTVSALMGSLVDTGS
ncbi:hypothetical protein [Paraburkholderia sp. HD33-4]|uniref:hypothetical protein n=1 Tax=Paraburkholderia sp. HD33-4 TaxID=2883242 RepID=UPI001F3FEF82|nr:hypothetical protein [Paraburkholderia sp. HD33-4]